VDAIRERIRELDEQCDTVERPKPFLIAARSVD
jgi:hypothetical protein